MLAGRLYGANRQPKEWSLNVVYILYFLLLFFDLFILFGW
jgi:hypothetical protein